MPGDDDAASVMPAGAGLRSCLFASMTSIKRTKSKSSLVADAVRADILSGKLRPGDRIKGIRELAVRFKVGARSAQTACELLEREGLLECRHGDGTYVRALRRDRDNTIYFLVPHAGHLTLNHETSVMLRHMLAGVIRAAGPGQLVHPLPVLRANRVNISKNPELVDWPLLERIPRGANVFVSGAWYGGVIPFLIERGVRGVYLSSQYEQQHPETWKIVRQAGWKLVVIDRQAAMQQAVQYLHAAGRRRPAAVKRVPGQPDHPFRQGFIAGLESCRLDFDAGMFCEYDPDTPGDRQGMIFDLWRRVRFDALVLCAAELAPAAYEVLTGKAGLRIPQDAAVMVYRDLPENSALRPALSAFDFPWEHLGGEIARLLNDDDCGSREVRFHASIMERSSTRPAR